MANKKEQNETPEGNTEQQQQDQPSIVESVVDTVTSAVSSVVEGASSVVESAASAIGLTSSNEAAPAKRTSNRAQKIGVVTSDKMTKTVVVRVDRQIMHPKYRRYVRRATKFMAHDEMGAGVGDKVRIMETRPLSARKRWRVVEIIQKAAR